MTKPAPVGRPPLPKGDGKTSHLHLRIEPGRKAAYVKAAKRSGLGKLAPWAIAVLDQAVRENKPARKCSICQTVFVGDGCPNTQYDPVLKCSLH